MSSTCWCTLGHSTKNSKSWWLRDEFAQNRPQKFLFYCLTGACFSTTASVYTCRYTPSWPKLLQNNSSKHFLLKMFFRQKILFVMLLPLACPFFQENNPRKLLCKVILLQYLQNKSRQNIICAKSLLIISLAAMVHVNLGRERDTKRDVQRERERHRAKEPEHGLRQSLQWRLHLWLQRKSVNRSPQTSKQQPPSSRLHCFVLGKTFDSHILKWFLRPWLGNLLQHAVPILPEFVRSFGWLWSSSTRSTLYYYTNVFLQ